MVKWGWMIWKRDNNRETKDQSKGKQTTKAAVVIFYSGLRNIRFVVEWH